MSVDVKDHRKFLEGKLKEEEARKAETKALLPQKESELATTGDEKFDKLIRALESMVTDCEKVANDAAVMCAGCVQEDMVRLKQFEFYYNKGHVDAFKKVMSIPAQILAEAKATVPSGTTVH